MRPTTLCFVKRGNEILLGRKKRGFGIHKYNGFGGKRQDGETFRQCATRELFEEVSLLGQEQDLEAVALMDFQFPNAPELSHLSYVYVLEEYSGTPLESEEMDPEWFTIQDIPYASMWDGDEEWIPLLWEGKKLKAVLQFDDDNSTVKNIRMEVVDSILESEQVDILYEWLKVE